MNTRHQCARVIGGVVALGLGAVLATTGTVARAVPPLAAGGLQLVPVGTYDGGGLARAEIVAFDEIGRAHV